MNFNENRLEMPSVGILVALSRTWHIVFLYSQGRILTSGFGSNPVAANLLNKIRRLQPPCLSRLKVRL